MFMFFARLLHQFVTHSPERPKKDAPAVKGFAMAVCLTIVSKKGTNPILRQAI